MVSSNIGQLEAWPLVGTVWCTLFTDKTHLYAPLAVVLFWLIITITKPPYSEPLKDLVNCTVTESCAQ